MRITAFWAKGYRSLADVHLEGLGPFNVFYGRNGAGKSNILAAMRTLFGLLAWRSGPTHDFEEPKRPFSYILTAAWPLLHSRDQSQVQRKETLMLGARIAWNEADHSADDIWPQGEELALEVTYDWFRQTLAISTLEWVPPGMLPRGRTAGVTPTSKARVQSLVHIIATRLYALIDAERTLRFELLTPPQQNDVSALLAVGKLKEGLFRASTHPNPIVRRRFKQLQELLTGSPLHRPPFELVHDPQTNFVELMESTSSSVQHPTEVPLDLAGLGIAQIYSILGQALLRDARAVAIEEPEAHLHAPSSGIHLRQLLERLVTEGYIDQLFIATHSNLFDLDSTGYYDVSLDERGATRVERKPLSEIDREHLYEPGPAKHALAEFLRYMEPDAVVFRRPDGSPVSVSEMLDMLQRDDPVAVEFLRDVHGAAVRAVRVKHKKPAASEA